VDGTVTGIECGIDVWQRVTVEATLTPGEWEIKAHNDDDEDPPASGNFKWSDPTGKVIVV
jgi:hypothetical protein